MKDRAKVVFVSLIIFFGTAFAIMSFNEDVAVQGLFEKIYMMITGTKHTGLGIIEISYGIGIALGITVFFNRLSDKKNNEPTPIELKMKQYEDQVNDYSDGGK
ncbi:MAG: hypothetical protein IIT48_00720 [Lachnospiraceae bacterium]|nr:hypothetical protein [Lachnospiraceae bacterium]